MNFAKFARTHFLETTTGQLFQIIAISIAVKWELGNETVNYDIDIKAYQFETEN